MAKSSDSGDETLPLGEETRISPPNDQTVAVAQKSLVASSFTGASGSGLSVSLNKETFDRANFGPQTNTQYHEEYKIEFANITHHHNHYHNTGQGNLSEDESAAAGTTEKKGAKAKEGYVELSPDIFIDNRKPLKIGKRVFQGYRQHVTGQTQKVGIKKIITYENEYVREVQHLVRLSQHPNVVQIFQTEKYEGLTGFELYIVMELCKVQNLHDYLEANRKNNKPFDLTQTMLHAKQLIDGLKHIHVNRIIHGDLKPGNILFSQDGTQIKVSDFGISKQLGDGRSKTNVTSQGTDGFRAPETFGTDGIISMKSDIYSLAITLYSMFTNGKHPFGEDQHLRIYNMKKDKGFDLSGLPDEMEPLMRESFTNLLTQMLKFAPRDRPSIEEVADHPFFSKHNDSAEVMEQSLVGFTEGSEEMQNSETGVADTSNCRNDELVAPSTKEASTDHQSPVLKHSKKNKKEKKRRDWKMWAGIAITVVFAVGIVWRRNETPRTISLKDNEVTLDLGSKFKHEKIVFPAPRMDFCAADAGPLVQPTIHGDGKDLRKKLQKLTGKTDFTQWSVGIFFNKASDTLPYPVANMDPGFHLCHKDTSMKEVRHELLKINMTYDDDFPKIELLDASPITGVCGQIAESPWPGMIFWFDNETLALYAINLGDLRVNFHCSIYDYDNYFEKPMPPGVRVPILPLKRYEHIRNTEKLVWSRVLVHLEGCVNSRLHILFHL